MILVVQIQAFHGLSFGEMGLLLALLSFVAIIVMAFVTPRLARFPLGALCAGGLLALGTGSLGMALLPSWALWFAFAIAGVGNGLVDVFLNVEGQRVESITNRPVLQWLHATYAVGGITGAVVGGIVAATHTNFRMGLLFGALMLYLAAFWNARAGTSARGATEVDSGFSLSAFRRHHDLWLPALVVLSAFLVEGSMDTWSGLYLYNELGASEWQAAMAFVAFSAAHLPGSHVRRPRALRAGSAHDDHGLRCRRRRRWGDRRGGERPDAGRVRFPADGVLDRGGGAGRVRPGRGGRPRRSDERDRRGDDRRILGVRLEPADLRVAGAGVRPARRDGASS